jgi:hypothetical protein
VALVSDFGQRNTRPLLISLLACLLGAGLICVDLVVRRFPRKKNFRIENSNGFLSASLSLSFGVMVGFMGNA